MAQNTIKYNKWRAFAEWLFNSLILCTIACSLLMTMVMAMDQFVHIVRIPEQNRPVMYTIYIMFILIMRSFSLISSLEKIEKGASTPTDENAGAEQISATSPLPSRVSIMTEEEKRNFLLMKEYEHKKTRIMVLHTCSAVAIFAGVTSMFFFWFVYDDAILRSKPVPVLDQILIPVMMGAAIVMFSVKATSLSIEALEKRLFSTSPKPQKQSAETEQPVLSELDHSFPDEIMDNNHQLRVSMSAFVRYCVKQGYYFPYTIKAWEPVGDRIVSQKGKRISAKQLAQSYQDLLSKGTL